MRIFELNESAIELGRTKKGSFTQQFFNTIDQIVKKRGYYFEKRRGWIKRLINLELLITEDEINAIEASSRIYSKKAEARALKKQQEDLLKLLTE